MASFTAFLVTTWCQQLADDGNRKLQQTQMFVMMRDAHADLPRQRLGNARVSGNVMHACVRACAACVPAQRMCMRACVHVHEIVVVYSQDILSGRHLVYTHTKKKKNHTQQKKGETYTHTYVNAYFA
jgi:hypothetical protein